MPRIIRCNRTPGGTGKLFRRVTGPEGRCGERRQPAPRNTDDSAARFPAWKLVQFAEQESMAPFDVAFDLLDSVAQGGRRRRPALSIQRGSRGDLFFQLVEDRVKLFRGELLVEQFAQTFEKSGPQHRFA